MKNIALIINSPPHGVAKGREALDVVLSLSDINHVSLFLIDDGVFHLLPNQQTDVILMRDYISTFKMLNLYDINEVYACQTSLDARNITVPKQHAEIKTITALDLNHLLQKQDIIFNF